VCFLVPRFSNNNILSWLYCFLRLYTGRDSVSGANDRGKVDCRARGPLTISLVCTYVIYLLSLLFLGVNFRCCLHTNFQALTWVFFAIRFEEGEPRIRCHIACLLFTIHNFYYGTVSVFFRFVFLIKCCSALRKLDGVIL
jgi:hypothetical protein